MIVLGLIPARGNSKGIPRKNIAPLAGRPLISWTIEACRAAKLVDRVVLSSDDQEILAVGRQWGAECPFVRPAELARDDTPALPVIRHAVEKLTEIDGYVPDAVALLQPTSPLRTARHIDEALALLQRSDADSVVSVVRVPHQFNPYSVMVRDGPYVKPYLAWDEKRNLRQSKPQFWARNGAAIYAFRYQCLMQKGSIFGERILAYEMERADSVDIDEPLDLEIAELLMQARLSQDRR